MLALSKKIAKLVGEAIIVFDHVGIRLAGKARGVRHFMGKREGAGRIGAGACQGDLAERKGIKPKVAKARKERRSIFLHRNGGVGGKAVGLPRLGKGGTQARLCRRVPGIGSVGIGKRRKPIDTYKHLVRRWGFIGE